jgi:hypothetical protein
MTAYDPIPHNFVCAQRSAHNACTAKETICMHFYGGQRVCMHVFWPRTIALLPLVFMRRGTKRLKCTNSRRTIVIIISFFCFIHHFRLRLIDKWVKLLKRRPDSMMKFKIDQLDHSVWYFGSSLFCTKSYNSVDSLDYH